MCNVQDKTCAGLQDSLFYTPLMLTTTRKKCVPQMLYYIKEKKKIWVPSQL